MHLIGAILIGIVQGLTECLPVSSSAHLVAAERILGLEGRGVALEVILHLGTLAAAVIYFRDRWARLLLGPVDSGSRRFIGMLVLGTLPAALVGVVFHDRIADAFHNPRLAAANLLACGIFLVLAGLRRPGEAGMTPLRALVVGVAQSVAILPGISRSGATVGTGLLTGVSPRGAVSFSFMLMVPAVAGATLMELRGIGEAAGAAGAVMLAAAAVSAFASGYLAITLFL